mmetsp:Transcript_29877/g.79505  ORF Transcript_29877/g.79505 Transcript_29877/m.79505 type:complete len:118 (-) Transcript_29877:1356-1709(-)
MGVIIASQNKVLGTHSRTTNPPPQQSPVDKPCSTKIPQTGHLHASVRTKTHSNSWKTPDYREHPEMCSEITVTAPKAIPEASISKKTVLLSRKDRAQGALSCNIHRLQNRLGRKHTP